MPLVKLLLPFRLLYLQRASCCTLVLMLGAYSSLSKGQSPQLSSRGSTRPLIGTNTANSNSEVKEVEHFVPYWTTEGSWQSELQLRNNLNDQDLTVRPYLRTADGAETSLPAVTIKPQEVKMIDVGAAAQQVGKSYGSVVLRFRSAFSSALYAALMMRDAGHPIAIHLDAIPEDQSIEGVSREGVWWLPSETTNDYLILTNQGSSAIKLDLSLYDAQGKEVKQILALGPRQTNRYSVRQFVRSAGLAGSYGGVKIFARAHAGSLDTVHFLFDEQAGFSALLKMFDQDPAAKIQSRDYAHTGVWTQHAPMLALSEPDPSLGFPEGTTLQPQVFVRNTTGRPVTATLRFNWRTQGGATGKVPGPTLRLAPFETRRIEIATLQEGNTLFKQANWTSVILTTKGLPDEVMAVAASYDATLRYGAQTPFSDQLAFRWAGGLWEYDPQHDSIITVGNGGTKPTQAAFAIFYNQGKERYELEQALQPDEQMWIDVGKLIREQVPDKNGKVLPLDLTSGSYEFRDLTNLGLGSLFEGKVIYDKTYGHVTYGCAHCCGLQSVYLQYAPLGVPFQGTSPNGVLGDDNCGDTGLHESPLFYGNWKTANTSIATVDYYATHAGHSVGGTSSLTSGQINAAGRAVCPVETRSPGGPTNVTPTVAIQGNLGYIYIGHDSQVTQHINALFGSGTPSGGAYQWSSPDSSISFDNSVAATVHLTAPSYSGGINDTQVTLNYTYNSQAAQQPASVLVTKRLFFFLAGDSIIKLASYNGPTKYGYDYQLGYSVFTHPDGKQVTDGNGVSTYESVTLVSSNVPFNPNYGQGALNDASQLVDTPSLISSTPLPSNLSIVDSQNLGVGGFYTRNNTLTYSSTGVTLKSNGPNN
jgi:hypothetical protein